MNEAVLDDLLKKWSEFEWEKFIPLCIRAEIISFWGAQIYSYIWNCNDSHMGHPSVGTRVVCMPVSGAGVYEGRWIPVWYNVGRVLLDDGTWQVSSTRNLVVV